MCSIILESILLGIYLSFKIYFLIDTNAKIWTEIIDLVVLGRNYWSSCRVYRSNWVLKAIWFNRLFDDHWKQSFVLEWNSQAFVLISKIKKARDAFMQCILYPSVSVSVWVWVWTAKWKFSHIQVIQITIQIFTLKNINIFYFEMSGQIVIWPFSIKKGAKISEQPTGNYAVHKSFGHSHSNTNGIWGIQSTLYAKFWLVLSN